LAQWTARILGPHALAVIAKTDQGLFAVDPQDFDVGRSLRQEGHWGQAELKRLAPHLQPQANVLVVGAHIGSLVVPLARLCQQVVAIEANPKSFELLQLNLRLNQINNCECFCVAASNQAEQLNFLVNPSNTGGSKRMPQTKKNIYYYDQPTQIKVAGVVLDDFLADQAFDLIVMDIEGSEYFALQGMQRILSQAQALQVEFLPHHLADVSGVSVAALLQTIAPHFSQLEIPSQNKHIPQTEFLATLTKMYQQGQGDDGLIFSK
jgi:FkbM family methyltransferase